MARAGQLDRQNGRAPRRFLRFVEEHGLAIRHRAGLGTEGRLDPYEAASEFGVVIAKPDELQRLDPRDLAQIRLIDARAWSGSAQELPDGRVLVLLNPNQTPERAASTLMEEIAHAYFGHQPTALISAPMGLTNRTYVKAEEDEAFWTGAAALLPSSVVARAVWHEIPADALAQAYGVSLELVEFRIKTLRLWAWYRDRRAAA